MLAFEPSEASFCQAIGLRLCRDKPLEARFQPRQSFVEQREARVHAMLDPGESSLERVETAFKPMKKVEDERLSFAEPSAHLAHFTVDAAHHAIRPVLEDTNTLAQTREFVWHSQIGGRVYHRPDRAARGMPPRYPRQSR